MSPLPHLLQHLVVELSAMCAARSDTSPTSAPTQQKKVETSVVTTVVMLGISPATVISRVTTLLATGATARDTSLVTAPSATRAVVLDTWLVTARQPTTRQSCSNVHGFSLVWYIQTLYVKFVDDPAQINNVDLG